MPESDWQLLDSRPVSDHRILRVRHDRYRLAPSPEEREFVVIEADDWVNVIPLTADGKVVFVRQFRHGVRAAALEVPGGIIDPGETPAVAAARELHEETGYLADTIRPLGFVWPNPAIQNNRCHSFVANVRPEGAPRFEAFERMEVELHPLADVPRMMRAGEILHSLVVTAFALLGVSAAGGFTYAGQ